MISQSLEEKDVSALGILADMQLRTIDKRHLPFLKYHREKVWRK